LVQVSAANLAEKVKKPKKQKAKNGKYKSAGFN
jgi:hypothetical protein